MRIITATAVAIVSLMVLGLSFAQTWSPTNNYDRCVGLAKWEGLDVKSAKGRASFHAACNGIQGEAALTIRKRVPPIPRGCAHDRSA